MEIKRYGLTDKEIETLQSAGISEDAINDLALERVEGQIDMTEIPQLDENRRHLYDICPDIPDHVADFLTEVMLNHPEEGEKAAKAIDEWLKEHEDDLPAEFDNSIIPTRREVGLYWAKKALGENPEPDPYWFGGKMLDFILTNILTDENVKNAVRDVKSPNLVY